MRSPGARALWTMLAAAPLTAVNAQAAEEERQVGSFSSISAASGVDVFLTQSNRQHVRIEATGVELEDVVTEVVDGELRIGRKRGLGFDFFSSGDIEAYVEFEQLSQIRASGGSDVSGEGTIEVPELTVSASGGSDLGLDLDVSQLELSLSGGSDARVAGSAQSLRIETSGGSDVSARELEADRAAVRASGGSDVSVHAREGIEVEASGGSDVVVYGDPEDRNVQANRSSDVAFR